MAASGEHFSLRWNNYSNHITNAFDSLRSQEDFVDVTLCCEGRKIRAHKVLLSACSLYFRDVFKENPCQHPVIVFKNVQYEDLLALIEFMYQGEVSVQQESLPSFLSTAELLSVQGLTGGTSSTTAPTVNEAPIISLPTSSQATYLTTHPSAATKLHHVPLKRTDTTSSAASKISTSGSPNIKTYSVQAVMNKTQMPMPISIPTTVKLRAIPATSGDIKPTLIEHPIVIHHQQQQQQQQQQQHHHQQQQQQQATGLGQHQTIDKNPAAVKKRRMSLDLSSNHAKTTRQIIDDAEYVLSDAIDTQEHHIHQQTSDEVDTQDEEEEEDDEEEETEQFLKMEIPFMEDDGQQQHHHHQQHDAESDAHNQIDDEMLDEDDEEHLDHVNMTGGVTTDQSQADGDEQYAMMDSSELDMMYQQQQQQQQGTEIGRMYVTQTSVDESSGQQEGDMKVTIAGGAQQSQDGGATGGPMNKWSQCQFCKVVITTVNLWRHIRTQHTPQPQRQCEHCRKKFKNKYSLREHVRIAHESKLNNTTAATTTTDPSSSSSASAAAAGAAVGDQVLAVVTTPTSAGGATVVTTRAPGTGQSPGAAAANVTILKPMATIKTIGTFPPSMY